MTFRRFAKFDAVLGASARAVARAAVLAAVAAMSALLLTPSAAPAAGAGKPAHTATPSPYPIASAVRVGGNQEQTRFVLDLSGKVDIAAFTLADPYRVVVDLPQVAFKLPKRAGEHGRGLITAYRYGLVMRGGSRIVLDTAKPVEVKKAFVLPPAAGQPARLVLDLAAIDRASFLRNIALQDRAKRPPPIAAVPKQSNDPRPLIVLDPGHGGIDNGTHWKNIDEKDIVLAFARTLREKLEHSGKYRVAMTRADDTYVTLGDRVQFARARRAALFISLHADSLPAKEGHAEGATVYTLSEKRLRRPGRRARQQRKRLRHHRRRRSLQRAERRRQHPGRSGAARDQDLFAAVRPQCGRRVARHRQALQASGQVGRLRGAERPGRAFGPDRARLPVVGSRPQEPDLAGLAGENGRRAGGGG